MDRQYCAMRHLSMAIGGLKCKFYTIKISIIEISTQRCMNRVFIPKW